MTAPATFADAVAAVEHDGDCASEQSGGCCEEYDHSNDVAGSCDCDRDARIAKGIEAVRGSDALMVNLMLVEGAAKWPTGEAFAAEGTAAALAAFVEAARG